MILKVDVAESKLKGVFTTETIFPAENSMMFNSVHRYSSLLILFCFCSPLSWACLNSGFSNLRSGFPFSVMVWRFPLLSPPQVTIRLLPPLRFLTMYLHTQNIMICVYHRILQWESDRPCCMNLSPAPGIEGEEPCILCQKPPRAASLQFPPSTFSLFAQRIHSGAAFLPFLSSIKFSGRNVSKSHHFIWM